MKARHETRRQVVLKFHLELFGDVFIASLETVADYVIISFYYNSVNSRTHVSDKFAGETVPPESICRFQQKLSVGTCSRVLWGRHTFWDRCERAININFIFIIHRPSVFLFKMLHCLLALHNFYLITTNFINLQRQMLGQLKRVVDDAQIQLKNMNPKTESLKLSSLMLPKKNLSLFITE